LNPASLSLRLVRSGEPGERTITEVALQQGQQRLLIGRDPEADWPFPDAPRTVSAHHCEIVATPEGWQLRDLSTNGTFVNDSSDRLAAPHRLHDGDRIQFGPYEVALSLPDDVELPVDPLAPLTDDEQTRFLNIEQKRGGDPAAMLPDDWRQAPPPPPDRFDADQPLPVLEERDEIAMTRIAPSVKPVRRSEPQPAVTKTEATPNETKTHETDWRMTLARAMGLPAEAFMSEDPEHLATRIGALTRATISGLRAMLDQQARLRRQIGSPMGSLRSHHDEPLRLAANLEEAISDLLKTATPDASVQQVCAHLNARQQQLFDAYRLAMQHLGEEFSPRTFEHSAGLPEASAARCWSLYTKIWTRMGQPAEQPWSQGFVEYALEALALALADGQGLTSTVGPSHHDERRPGL
jgi:type VI secretion system protein